MGIRLTNEQEEILLFMYEKAKDSNDNPYDYGVSGPELAKVVSDGQFDRDPIIQLILNLADYKESGQEVYSHRLGILSIDLIKQTANPFGFWLTISVGSLGLNINRIDKGLFKIYSI